MEKSLRIRPNAFTRPNAIAQIALRMARDRPTADGPYRDLRFSMGTVQDGTYLPALTFGTENPDVLEAVGRGEVDLATINPSAYLTMAYLGTGPFPEPLPVRTIAVMPSFDLMGFALAEWTGLTTLAEVREQKYPLRISLRDNPSHAPLFVVDEVLRAEGMSLAEIESWGGSIQWVEARPAHPLRTGAMQFGNIDAVFDEGINGWGPVALKTNFRFARLQDSTLAHMEEIGWPLCPIRDRFPEAKDDVQGISFSGWPLYTHAGVSDEQAYQMVDALYRARESIQFDSEQPVELADLCGSTQAAPRDVPLHPGAERYYREKGALE